METKEFYKGKETVCDCGHIAICEGFTTGYGVNKDGGKICFACCAENDKKELRETGKLSGYISGTKENGYKFTNWPGSFSIPVDTFYFSWHNFAGKNGRMDFWLNFEGENYHGLNVGDNQCATIRRTKGQSKIQKMLAYHCQRRNFV